jgi:hypothetical protein
MDDAEPSVPFNDGGGDATPRPGGFGTETVAETRQRMMEWKEWRCKFSEAATASAKKYKKRRSLNTRTYYRPSTSHKFQTDLSVLKHRVDAAQAVPGTTNNPELMTQKDFELLKMALTRFRIRFEVGDAIDMARLQCLRSEAQTAEDAAAAETTAAFAKAMIKHHQDQVESHNDLDYKTTLAKFNALKAWRIALSREITRCSYTTKASPNVPPSPSQHAKIAASAHSMLVNILTPETLNQTFVSLNVLTSTINAEMTAFLTDTTRQRDRIIVVEQIRTSIIHHKKQAALTQQ